MNVTARSEYALRAVAELAVEPDRPLSCSEVAARQQLPGRFLEAILRDLVRERIVVSHRGAAGGFALARSADLITVAEVLRAVDGPLVAVRGLAPEEIAYTGSSQALTRVWVAARAALRDVLETTTVAALASGELAAEVDRLVASEDAWRRR